MAQAQSKQPRPFRFRGTPLSLCALVPEPVASPDDIVVSLQLPDVDGAALDAVVAVESDPRILRLSLPAAFPPGVYQGTATMAGVQQPVVAEVEAQPALRAFPERMLVESPPGGRIDFELGVLNTGNVTIDIRRNHLVGIFLEGGLERAIRQAYAATLEKGQRRVDVLADALAQSHGGLVAVTVTEGAGELAPQQARDLHLEVKVPDGLEAGHVYSGNLEIESLVHPVRIVVPAEARRPGTRKKERGR